MTRGLFLPLAILATALSAGGCSAPYVSGYTYYPQPATVEVVHNDANQQTPLMVLVSVLGVHNEDSHNQIPYSVVVRMRFENVAQSKVTFDPASLELVTGTLRSFSRPRVSPAGTMTLSPGDRKELTAYFPFPPDTGAQDMNLRNLRLRWEIKIDSSPVIQTVVFERAEGGNDVDYDTDY